MQTITADIEMYWEYQTFNHSLNYWHCALRNSYQVKYI